MNSIEILLMRQIGLGVGKTWCLSYFRCAAFVALECNFASHESKNEVY